MKKKLLFVIPSLDAGGAEKSLVNLLNVLDFSQYEVDLFLFSKKGLFLNQVPKEVNFVDGGIDFETFKKPLLKSVFSFLLKGKFELVKARFDFYKTNKNISNKAVAEQNSWKFMEKSLLKISKKYDAAIAYLEKSSVYFVAEKTRANKKLAWIHTDYETSGMNPDFDRSFFSQMNALITISENCKRSLQKHFQECRTEIIENISSAKLIDKLSQEKIQIENTAPTKILSVARLSKEKGIDIAVETAKILKEKKLNFVWEIIGSGSEKENLEKQISELGLGNSFKLLGLKENPYPYLKNCDVYVQPSRCEGKSIAIDEALILKKLIVVTNFSTAKDQIADRKNGLIAEMNPQSLAEKILEIFNNSKLRSEILNYLNSKNYSNEWEIEKLYKLIND